MKTQCLKVYLAVQMLVREAFEIWLASGLRSSASESVNPSTYSIYERLDHKEGLLLQNKI